MEQTVSHPHKGASIALRRVTVLIPTKDRTKDLRRLLGSLSAQSDPDFDILIVNNGGTENAEVAKSFGNFRIRICDDRTPNLSRLFNHGLESANNDLIAYVNDDTEVSHTWIEDIKEAFERSPQVAAVGGPTISPNTHGLQAIEIKLRRRSIVKPFLSIVNLILYSGRFTDIGYLSTWGTYSIGGSMLYSTELRGPIKVDALSVTNMAIRKDVLREIGGFDETFRYSHADGDLFVRLKRKNETILFDPKLRVVHYSTPGVRGTRSAFWLARDYAIFLRKLKPNGLSSRLRLLITIVGFISFWSWTSISYRTVSPLSSAMKGLRVGFREKYNS